MSHRSAQVKDILELLEDIAPLGLAQDWDNCGLILGDPGAYVKTILVALDPTDKVLKEAARAKAQLLLTHHPLILKPIKSINKATPLGRALAFLLSKDIALVACHTNFDLAIGGVADLLAKRLGFGGSKVLLPDPRGLKHRGRAVGFGRVVEISEPLSINDLALRLSSRLNARAIRVAGVKDAVIQRLALIPGSGGELIPEAAKKGCQAVVTGDVKHHQARDAESLGIAVLDIGHFASEMVAVEGLAAYLKTGIKGRGFKAELIQSKSEEEPLKVMRGVFK